MTHHSCRKADNADRRLRRLCNVEEIVEQGLVLVMRKEIELIENK